MENMRIPGTHHSGGQQVSPSALGEYFRGVHVTSRLYSEKCNLHYVCLGEIIVTAQDKWMVYLTNSRMSPLDLGTVLHAAQIYCVPTVGHGSARSLRYGRYIIHAL